LRIVVWRVQETVKGSWISETLVTCDTPPFEKYGAGDVIVKVQVGGEGFTVHKVRPYQASRSWHLSAKPLLVRSSAIIG
jgi:hypothetical protein